MVRGLLWNNLLDVSAISPSDRLRWLNLLALYALLFPTGGGDDDDNIAHGRFVCPPAITN